MVRSTAPGATAVAAAIALLGTPAAASAETSLGEVVVADFDTLVLDAFDSPYTSQGVSVGNPPHSTVLPPSEGEVIVGEGVEWTNTGRFWVGAHFGFQQSSGSVVFGPNTVFNSTSTPNVFPELPNDVRIGVNGTGSVSLDPDAVWNNTGVPNQVSFTVGNNGFLDIQGQLLGDASSVIDGGTVLVRGSVTRPEAVWQVGGFGLDIEGFDQAGELWVTDGGRVTDMFFAQVGFSDGNSGSLFVGNPPLAAASTFGDDEFDAEPVRSVFAPDILEIGVFGSASGYVEVNQDGRIDIGSLLRMGRGGGTGELVVNEGGEVLVGGFDGGGFFGQSVEIWSGSTINLRGGGGKLVIGTDTTSLGNPVDGTGNAFDEIDPGTLLVGNGGELKGTGRVVADVLVGDGGLLSPGHSPGLLAIDGDLTLASGGTLLMEIDGATPDLYDRLEVTGLLTLGGTLELAFGPDFDPGEGETFELALFNAIVTGSFDEVVIAGFGKPLQFDLNSLLTGQPTTFSVVPVPAAAWLFGSALGLLGVARRRPRALPLSQR